MSLLKLLGLMLASQVVFAANAWAITMDRSTTAVALYLAENKTADLQNPYVKDAVSTIESELQLMLDTGLIDKNFFMPQPFAPGKLLFQVDTTLQNSLDQVIGSDGVLDLLTERVSVLNFDLAFALAGATEIRKASRFYYELTIHPDVNPYRVALQLGLFPEFDWLEAESVFMIGGDRSMSRMDGYPSLYRLMTGWGDCPAGCIYRHHTYIEVNLGHNSATILAETGDALLAP